MMFASRGAPRLAFGRRGITHAVAAAVLAICLGAPFTAQAHQLSVFARAQDDVVAITANFADGTAVKSGQLRVYSADNTLILQQDVDGTWPVLFPVGPHTDGLRIQVDAGNGHDNYWLLTPADLAPADLTGTTRD